MVSLSLELTSFDEHRREVSGADGTLSTDIHMHHSRHSVGGPGNSAVT